MAGGWPGEDLLVSVLFDSLLRISSGLMDGSCSAFQAIIPVNAESLTTTNTSPSFFFLVHECLQALIFDGIQVFNHTHTILQPIALVELAKPFARILYAFIAKPGGGLCQNFTVFDDTMKAISGFI